MKKKIKKIKKIICFDIDNVLCKTQKSKYLSSKPNIQAIRKINELHDRGYKIILFTSRFMGRTNDNIKKAYSLGFRQTSSQLKEWKVKYDKLIMGKPSYDLIVDDLSIYFKKSWIKDIDSYL